MSFGKKALLLGIAIVALYAVLATVAYYAYTSLAYSSYNKEQARLDQEYAAQMEAVPANRERLEQMKSRFDDQWDSAKAEIEARRERALEPIREEYWARMAEAKRKRDSTDDLEQIRGSTDELRAENAWRTDSDPVVSQYSREIVDALEAHTQERDRAIEDFQERYPTEDYLVDREYASENLLPKMSGDELQSALKVGGIVLLALYVACVCIQAIRRSG